MEHFYKIKISFSLGIVLFMMVSLNVWSQSGWTKQTSSTYPALLSVWAVDSDHIWAVGNEGTVLYSTNGGIDWGNINTGYSDAFYVVTFLNQDVGFISGDADDGKPYILKTVDEGENWEKINLASTTSTYVTDIDFYYVEASENYTLYASGGLEHVWKSTDTGDSWIGLGGGCENGNFNACCIIDENTGWFVGTPDAQYKHTIMQTTNGGVDFTEQINPEQIKLNGVSFIDENKGVAVGLAATILYTANGGTTWEARTNSGWRWQSCDMKPSGKVWAVGSSGNVGYSSDFGYSWELQASGQSAELWDVHFINDYEGWIVGGLAEGFVLHTSTGGVPTGTEDLHATEGSNIKQNYPNPVNDICQIDYELVRAGKVSICLYDVTGDKLKYLVNEFKPVGKFSISVDLGMYPSGIYFYDLCIDQDLVQVRKMIVSK